MSVDPGAARRFLRYLPYGIGVLLLAAGGALLYFTRSRFEVRALGLLACVLSAYTIRSSQRFAKPAQAATAEQVPSDGNSRKPTKKMRAIGAGLLVLVGIAYDLLYQDALNGYKDILPVYLFTGVGLVAAVFWGYLISKLT